MHSSMRASRCSSVRVLVEQFAVAVLEDLGLGQFGEAVHAQRFGGDAVVAVDERCDCLAAGEVAG